MPVNDRMLEQLLENIRVERARKNWTQKDLALKSGVSEVTLSRLMSGKIKSPALDTIQRIAMALGVSMDAICPTPQPTPKRKLRVKPAEPASGTKAG